MRFIFAKKRWAFHNLGFKMQFLVLPCIVAYISNICHFSSNFGSCTFHISGCDKSSEASHLDVGDC